MLTQRNKIQVAPWKKRDEIPTLSLNIADLLTLIPMLVGATFALIAFFNVPLTASVAWKTASILAPGFTGLITTAAINVARGGKPRHIFANQQSSTVMLTA